MSIASKVLVVGTLFASVLFFLKVAQVGLAAEWSWLAIVSPLWVPAVVLGLLRLAVYVEENRHLRSR